MPWPILTDAITACSCSIPLSHVHGLRSIDRTGVEKTGPLRQLGRMKGCPVEMPIELAVAHGGHEDACMLGVLSDASALLQELQNISGFSGAVLPGAGMFTDVGGLQGRAHL